MIIADGSLEKVFGSNSNFSSNKKSINFYQLVNQTRDAFHYDKRLSAMDSLISGLMNLKYAIYFNQAVLEQRVPQLIKLLESSEIDKETRVNLVLLLGHSKQEQAAEAITDFISNCDIDSYDEMIAGLLALGIHPDHREKHKEFFADYSSRGGSDDLYTYRYIASFYLATLDSFFTPMREYLINDFHTAVKHAVAKGVWLNSDQDLPHKLIKLIKATDPEEMKLYGIKNCFSYTGELHNVDSETYRTEGHWVAYGYNDPNPKKAITLIKRYSNFREYFTKGIFPKRWDLLYRFQDTHFYDWFD